MNNSATERRKLLNELAERMERGAWHLRICAIVVSTLSATFGIICFVNGFDNSQELGAIAGFAGVSIAILIALAGLYGSALLSGIGQLLSSLLQPAQTEQAPPSSSIPGTKVIQFRQPYR